MLASKLRTFALLGRHGSTDGYSFAVEYLALPDVRDAAIDAVVACKTPRTIDDLRAILRTSHDPAWNSAALRALARLGQTEISATLFELIDDLSNPQAPSALLALADLKDTLSLGKLGEAVLSRSDELALAGIAAARQLLAEKGNGQDTIRDNLAQRLADPLSSAPVREAALKTLQALEDPRLARALPTGAREAALENTPLLAQFEDELARQRIPLKLPRD